VALVVQPEARVLPPIDAAPQLSSASCVLVREIQVLDERDQRSLIRVPAEQPLTVFVDARELVTLMTLGAAPELLVLGYLCNQRLIASAAQIESITVDWQRSAAAVITRSGLHGSAGTVGRTAATACGQGTMFGQLMSRLDAIELPAVGAARIRRATLLRLLDIMRAHQSIHRSSGSVHSCALFREAEMLVAVEDVGRHNAVDTIAGWMALHGVAGADKILFTTGRLTSEMVLKAAQCGVPIVVSRNGVSAMGYDLAARFAMTLFGRAANRHFICYVGAERFDAEHERAD
jgi:FdhD protein